MSWFCRIFLKWIVDLIWIKEVKGLENIPKTNFILASNHQSHWDQVINGYLCVPRKFTYLGQIDKYSGFQGFLRDLFYKIGGVIPIHRYNEESKKQALEECKRRLKKGEILIMYPEGTRSPDGKIHEGKPGIAKLHLETGIPILPVAIKGNFEIMPIGKIFPKFKKIVKINIGKPMEFKEEIEKAKNLAPESQEYKEICQKITDKVMAQIKDLFEAI
ncbi:1-acyl-sn-glycerol-3-phosphate acyltransferase [Candidatus Parcubacteria bacterium]|nr:1-acyl-sn-glycerol-3-phosphate acyltransferase [Candidatus Parcubacteria bacterium]